MLSVFKGGPLDGQSMNVNADTFVAIRTDNNGQSVYHQYSRVYEQLEKTDVIEYYRPAYSCKGIKYNEDVNEVRLESMWINDKMHEVMTGLYRKAEIDKRGKQATITMSVDDLNELGKLLRTGNRHRISPVDIDAQDAEVAKTLERKHWEFC